MAGNQVLSLTDANFKSEVLQADQPVMVDFWAAWCGPCRMIAPVVEQIADDYAGRLKVGKLNVDENGATAAEYGIMSIPTLLFFKNGEVVERVVGYKTKEELSQVVEKVLG
ncbi:thioredoxin [Calderihabitans maritimus]|uniref:Thioredoxin n=1 Tax=Calderihabitans maritimus TaxID=1246530 RepID=A0A1Z5HTT9_9FIRM|nr:thioredoxin [Calderihabitans maritimus]GAW92690.1 thioredoxin [Calderihabitans maritimus]